MYIVTLEEKKKLSKHSPVRTLLFLREFRWVNTSILACHRRKGKQRDFAAQLRRPGLASSREDCFHGAELCSPVGLCVDLAGTVCRCGRHSQEKIFTVTDAPTTFPEKGKRVLSP